MHVIRLRGPWRGRVSEHRNTDQAPVNVRLPAAAASLNLQSGYYVELARVFNLPTGLDAETTVAISLGSAAGEVIQASLNEQPLLWRTPLDPQRWRSTQVADALRDRNVLQVTLCIADPAADLLQAQLEIG